MIAVVSLLFLATFFVVASRVGTVALEGTGMATDAANFQARSALMGVGYTTRESEDVINHPVRRKIILWLMTFGNAGIITGITSLVLGFINTGGSQTLLRGSLLIAGLLALIVLTRSRFTHRLLTRATRWALARWTDLDTRDLASLLRFSRDYGIIELAARSEDWLVDRPLANLHLPAEGIVILGIDRHDGKFIGAPTGKSVIGDGDTVIAYGRLDHLQELDDRHKGRDGDLAHDQAVREQEEFVDGGTD